MDWHDGVVRSAIVGIPLGQGLSRFSGLLAHVQILMRLRSFFIGGVNEPIAKRLALEDGEWFKSQNQNRSKRMERSLI